jgi:hypothetical protein
LLWSSHRRLRHPTLLNKAKKTRTAHDETVDLLPPKWKNREVPFALSLLIIVR